MAIQKEFDESNSYDWFNWKNRRRNFIPSFKPSYDEGIKLIIADGFIRILIFDLAILL